MAQAKRIFDNQQVNNFFPYIVFFVTMFSKKIENMYFEFLSCFRNTRESLGELERAVETLACSLCSHGISQSPKNSTCFLFLKNYLVKGLLNANFHVRMP